MNERYADHFPALRHVHLEDSWVLDVEHADDWLAFTLEVVLTADHPMYRGPRSGEQYDYRPARLVVAGDAVEYVPSGLPRARDATGETDSGNIDAFTSEDGQVWHLEGQWGRAAVASPTVTLALLHVG